MTLAWWADVWSSPMAPEFDSSDRHGLFALAVLIEDFWSTEDPRTHAALAGEIRLQRQCFGLTPMDRRRLQWEIDPTQNPGPAAAPAKARTVKRKAPAADPRAVLYAVK